MNNWLNKSMTERHADYINHHYTHLLTNRLGTR